MSQYGCVSPDDWHRFVKAGPCAATASGDGEVIVDGGTSTYKGWPGQPTDVASQQSQSRSSSHPAVPTEEQEEQKAEEEECVEVQLFDMPKEPSTGSSTSGKPWARSVPPPLETLDESKEVSSAGTRSPHALASKSSGTRERLMMTELSDHYTRLVKRSPSGDQSSNSSNPQSSVVGEDLLAEMDYTEIDHAAFNMPLQPIKMSGGTAAFYTIELIDAVANGASKRYWIGKDLAHAKDEIVFYETALKERKGRLGALLDFMFEYGGVAKCPVVSDHDKVRERHVLVMRNLMDGTSQLRLLDLKIGRETAVRGWKGKSRFGALRQKVIDTLTNSAGQGFRLEGFDSPPQGLVSMDPLQDLGGSDMYSPQMVKKCRRIQYQRLKASEIMMHFIDVRDATPQPPDCDSESQRLASVEWMEVVMASILRQLMELHLACALLDTPQKWIGSSVALGFDVATLPSREEVKTLGGHGFVRVNIFDWGRSELNCPGEHSERDKKAKEDREKFWDYYQHGVSMLCWEVARTYFHQFCNYRGWTHVRIDVYDFSSQSDKKFIGSCTIKLEEATKERVPITFDPPRRHGNLVKNKKKLFGCIKTNKKVATGAVIFSCEWRNFPSGSRLLGAWYFTLHAAEGLKPNNTMQAKPCAQAVVTGYLIGKARRVWHGHHRWCQQSKVVQYDENPCWEALFQIPTLNLANGHVLDIFTYAGVDSLQSLTQFLPSPGTRFEKKAFEHWCSLFSSRIDITEL
mmetsp:Transcript_43211/g.78612  ORF Transcript_43211/g.78612 Transcript_43211/m.78612 type:complete len:743 (-) Transcript_43211:115-2343(-)